MSIHLSFTASLILVIIVGFMASLVSWTHIKDRKLIFGVVILVFAFGILGVATNDLLVRNLLKNSKLATLNLIIIPHVLGYIASLKLPPEDEKQAS